MKQIFRIKICGVTSAESVAACVSAGADAIGLNCFAKSKRYLSSELARPVLDAIPPNVCRVGVFVNEGIDALLKRADELQLDLIQLHGDEDAVYAASLRGRRYIRAFRFDERGFEPVVKFLADTAIASCPPEAILIDAHMPGEYGGTGAKADWDQVASEKHLIGETKLILAGGLTSSNVRKAIELVGPYGVDTASGVESSPGIKDPDLSTLFVKYARESLKN